MNYKEIQGWFNFEEVYFEQVGKRDNCLFLEIGAWKGKSTFFLAEQIIDQGKNIQIFSVDFWEDENNEAQYWELLKGSKVSLYEEFLNNMLATKTQEVITPFKMSSDKFFEIMKGSSPKFDFIYIDGSHQYDQVKKDVQNSLVHLKSGGLLAGHDYNAEGVKQAVDEVIGAKNITTFRNTWMMKIV